MELTAPNQNLIYHFADLSKYGTLYTVVQVTLFRFQGYYLRLKIVRLNVQYHKDDIKAVVSCYFCSFLNIRNYY